MTRISLIQRTEGDDSVHVIVFTSADPDYFISHVDVTRINEYRHEAAKLTGEASIALLFRYLNAIALAPVGDFRRDSDLFGEEVRRPEAQSRIRAAITRGFQTRDGELALAPMLGTLADR